MPPPSIPLKENVPLAPFTTFRIGGPARFYLKVTSEPQLLAAVQHAREHHLDLFILGGGSNVLIADAGFPGLVLHLALTGPALIDTTPEAVTYTVPAGTDWDAFTLSVCQANLSGIECLAGIPGLVGGSPIQNIGAYGQEVADTITHVRALDRETLAFVTLPAADCRFAYRRSIFNSTHRNRYIVTAVTFRFNPAATPNLTYADLKNHFANRPAAEPPTPIDVYHAVREIRRAKGMLLVEGDPDCRSAGSFFKNPIVPAATLTHIAATLNLPADKIPHWPAPDGLIKLPAAWLLDQAGFHKGYTPSPESPAAISSRHTLALINRNHATAADILALRDRIRAEILHRFHITLEQEPVQLGT